VIVKAWKMEYRGYYFTETVEIKLFTCFKVIASWIGESWAIWGKCQIFKWNDRIQQYRNQQTVAYKTIVAIPFTKTGTVEPSVGKMNWESMEKIIRTVLEKIRI
jgi:hypothetical protein